MLSHPIVRTVAVVTVVLVLLLPGPDPADAQTGNPSPPTGLSPYWKPAVVRWGEIILQYAGERKLDPDLVAAVIWKESSGNATAVGPDGATGLMGIMPFDWRPEAEELLNPWTNVLCGTRTLAQVIRDGKGDLFYALAAYNGGWERTNSRYTRNYAADVMLNYARAIAMRHALPIEANWIAIFGMEGACKLSTVTVVGPYRPFARYTERPWLRVNLPAVPAGVPPHAVAFSYVNGQGEECRVGVWLLTEEGAPLPRLTEQKFVPPATAVPVLVSAPVGPVETPEVSSSLPVPTSTLTSTLPLTPTVVCEGGPLEIYAWDLGKALSPRGGWTATIFIQGRGGDCLYTYAWNDEIKGGPMSTPITFEVYMPDRMGNIIGTASVTSAGQTVKRGLFISHP
ncbi:MAG: transglycosylase SLT domain-containing protein [Anaerolineae bacterium]|nr:transglycosylase SLT domain-containing protein [Anaerolineae bacterium]